MIYITTKKAEHNTKKSIGRDKKTNLQQLPEERKTKQKHFQFAE